MPTHKTFTTSTGEDLDQFAFSRTHCSVTGFTHIFLGRYYHLGTTLGASAASIDVLKLPGFARF